MQKSAPPADATLEQQLLEAVQSDIESVRAAAEHLIAAGGKRARPRFAFLIGELLGVDPAVAAAVGAAAELVHTATLLHDDVLDGSDRRRGRPAVHATFGIRNAILTGDFLLARAIEHLTARGLFQATHELTRAVRELVEAELLQQELAWNAAITQAQARRVAEGKTGALFAWCARGLAVEGKLDAAGIASADALGRDVGFAFQIADDLLDIHAGGGDKPTRADLRAGHVTFPVRLACDRDAELEAAIRTAFASRREADFEAACAAVERSPAVALARTELEQARKRFSDAVRAAGASSELAGRMEGFFDAEISRQR